MYTYYFCQSRLAASDLELGHAIHWPNQPSLRINKFFNSAFNYPRGRRSSRGEISKTNILYVPSSIILTPASFHIPAAFDSYTYTYSLLPFLP
ncbi:hypothetical protein LshimejAT787_2001380 [Lyophyllum shimeji]|uniref:Uncharacterized protein n=1 Tax=Lyophyllum shimeji TaxID=47721 RepID=A0A9P3UU45_LYOSH|nr:hypothetical protein LshimejAT787_2001380 [Lyophyllum shimeji]